MTKLQQLESIITFDFSWQTCNRRGRHGVKWPNQLNKKYMDVAVIGTMIPIIAIIGTFVMIIYLRKYDNQERMAMIDKGVDPKSFINTKPRNAAPALRAS